MVKYLAFLLTLIATACAQAACTGPTGGTSVAGGINMTMGTPAKFQVMAVAGCVIQPPNTLTVSGTAPGTIVTVTPDTSANQDFKFVPTAVGSGNVAFSATGFTTLTVPVTVSPGNLDVVPGN